MANHSNGMSDTKLRTILSHEAQWREYEFIGAIRRLRERLDNPCRFWSSERIVDGLNVIYGALADFVSFAQEQLECGSRSDVGVQIACDAVEAFWGYLEGWIPHIVWPPDGKPIAGHDEVGEEVQVFTARVRRMVEGGLHSFQQYGRERASSGSDSDEWGNMPERPLGELPTWINMYQAAAWVVFRTERALVELHRPSLLYGELRFSERPKVCELEAFETALRAGRPVCEAIRGDSGSIAAVPNSAWNSMDAVPLYPDHDAYFRNITIRRDILVSAFPSRATLKTHGRRSLMKIPKVELRNWFGQLGGRQALAQSQLYKLALVELSDFRVTHEDIRELTPDRLRGRKPKYGIRRSDLPPNSTS